jgi:hypothetical protein
MRKWSLCSSGRKPRACGRRLRRHARQGRSGRADEANRRVDITIDGQPFTSYIWPTTLKKPVLYPLIDDEGVTVTRGYPLPLPASASTILTTPACGSTTKRQRLRFLE